MSDARLAPSVEVSALLKQVQAAGGFGAVLHKGDPDRGSILLLVAERGVTVARLQRLLQRDGSYAWEATSAGDSGSVQQHLARARTRDPDLWVLELDVPSSERFIAEMIGSP